MKKIGILFLLICFNSQSQNLTIQNGGSLTIEKSGSMNVAGNFSNSGTVTMNSDGDEFSAMKVSGSTSGTITYNRFVNVAEENEWDLIGSPVGGLSISNFVADNSGTLATNGSQYAVGYYDNETNDWTNYTTATVASANDFDIGKGYQMGTVSGGSQILAFTGTISANDETQSVINNNAANGGNGRRWNLVANPYPTYLNANDDADNTNNFLTTNVSKIDSEFLAIYGWDADGTGYTARGHDFNSNAAVYLAPGQAFFIASDDVVGENITFSEAMQTVSPASSDDFIQGDLRSQTFVNGVFDCYFDEVYQLAADMGGAGYIFTGENDADIMYNSALINLNVLNACIVRSITNIFYSSSACMYPEHNQLDPDNPNCSEDSAYPANPDSEYGWEKLFSERLYLAYNKNYSMNCKVARYHNIFGPEGTWAGGKEKAPAAICRKVAVAQEGTQIEIWGDGKQTRSFLYIDECIEGTLRLMRSNMVGPFNIGSDEMISINDLASMVIAISNKSLSIKNVSGPQGVRGRNSDNKLIEKNLNWKPTMKLRDGMMHTYNWIRSQI